MNVSHGLRVYWACFIPAGLLHPPETNCVIKTITLIEPFILLKHIVVAQLPAFHWMFSRLPNWCSDQLGPIPSFQM